MKYIAVLLAIAAIAVTSSEAHPKSCSFNNYKPVKSLSLLGKWITFLRYDNGPQKNTKCSFYEVVTTGTKTIDYVSNIWGDGVKSCMKGDLTDTSSDLALLHISWADKTAMPIAIVSTDNKNFIIGRACHENEEYVWIMTKTTKPSKEVIDLIHAAVHEQKLDEWKLRRSCIGFDDSELNTYL